MLGNILNHHWNGNISLMSNDDGRELIALKKNCLKFIINQASWFQPFVTKLSCSSFLYWPTGAQTSSPFHLTQLGQKVPVEAQRETWAYQEDRVQGPKRAHLFWLLNFTVGGTRFREDKGPDNVTWSMAGQPAFLYASAEKYYERTCIESQGSRFGTQLWYCELCDIGTKYLYYF